MRPDDRAELGASLRSTAHLFRLSMEAQASDSLVAVVDRLSALLQGAQRTDAEALAGILGDVVRAQQNGDALRLADLLEYELAPRLEAAP